MSDQNPYPVGSEEWKQRGIDEMATRNREPDGPSTGEWIFLLISMGIYGGLAWWATGPRFDLPAWPLIQRVGVAVGATALGFLMAMRVCVAGSKRSK